MFFFHLDIQAYVESSQGFDFDFEAKEKEKEKKKREEREKKKEERDRTPPKKEERKKERVMCENIRSPDLMMEGKGKRRGGKGGKDYLNLLQT